MKNQCMYELLGRPKRRKTERKPDGTVSDRPGADLGAGERGTQVSAAVKNAPAVSLDHTQGHALGVMRQVGEAPTGGIAGAVHALGSTRLAAHVCRFLTRGKATVFSKRTRAKI